MYSETRFVNEVVDKKLKCCDHSNVIYLTFDKDKATFKLYISWMMIALNPGSSGQVPREEDCRTKVRLATDD